MAKSVTRIAACLLIATSTAVLGVNNDCKRLLELLDGVLRFETPGKGSRFAELSPLVNRKFNNTDPFFIANPIQSHNGLAVSFNYGILQESPKHPKELNELIKRVNAAGGYVTTSASVILDKATTEAGTILLDRGGHFTLDSTGRPIVSISCDPEKALDNLINQINHEGTHFTRWLSRRNKLTQGGTEPEKAAFQAFTEMETYDEERAAVQFETRQAIRNNPSLSIRTPSLMRNLNYPEGAIITKMLREAPTLSPKESQNSENGKKLSRYASNIVRRGKAALARQLTSTSIQERTAAEKILKDLREGFPWSFVEFIRPSSIETDVSGNPTPGEGVLVREVRKSYNEHWPE